MFQKIKNFGSQHKISSGVIIIIIILGSYFGYKSLAGDGQEIRYALAAVTKGTIITSISGSGQVSVSDQIDVKPKVSGDVIYVGVKNGQEVRTGQTLVQLDASDAQKAVRDAQISLENAQITLAKLKLNQEADIPKLQDSITNAQNNLEQAYQNGFNNVANAFLDLPDIQIGIRGILYDTTVGTTNQSNVGAYQDLMDDYNRLSVTVMITKAVADYQDVYVKYNNNLDDYKSATRYSDSTQIISLINETLETAKTTAQTVKDEQNFLDAVVTSLKQYQTSRQIPAAITQYQASIASYIGKLNSHITNLNNIQSSITSNLQTLASSQRSLDIAQKSNPLDLASQENAVKQREVALQDAQDNLANYYVRAPFAGVASNVEVKRGDSISSATVVATLLTKQSVAEISLNEVDVAKVKTGQKATLTFDAVDNLTITGEVMEIDSIGTVSQGVVTYNLKIGFDTQDERIKPGMSVSAAIVTDSKQNVLLVPNSAVKTATGASYVEVPADAAEASQLLANSANSVGIALAQTPTQQTIKIGLADDSMTEVVSGLEEGDLVVTRTISSTATSTTTQNNSSGSTQNKGIFGGSSGGNTMFRTQAR